MLGAMSSDPKPVSRLRSQVEGLTVLGGMVGLMWLLEVINTADSNGLDGDGIVARNVGRLWGILTSPFIHASFQHLIANTIPLVFLGLIVALRGARRLLRVSAVVILFGGLGTWLIGPSGVSTIGASGLVFGYATYLLTRGFFDRSALELLTGLIVEESGVLRSNLGAQPISTSGTRVRHRTAGRRGMSPVRRGMRPAAGALAK